MNWIAAAAASAGVLYFFDATAQTACGPRREVAEFLRQRYREVVVAQGVTASGALLEVLAAPGGSWSLIVTAPDGRACVLASGEGWQAAHHDKLISQVEHTPRTLTCKNTIGGMHPEPII